MPDDWFKQNAPAPDDWFVTNAPKKEKQSPDLPDVTNQDLMRLGKYGLHLLPAAAATGAAIMQPEFFPAVVAAALGGLGGSAVEQGIESVAGMEERPRSIGEATMRLGKEGVKQAALEGGGRLLAKPFEFIASKFAPERLYGSALKPSTTLKVAKRERVIGTGLGEQIPVSRAGYEKLTASINDLTKQIDAKIAAKSPDIGAVIDPRHIARRLDALEEFYAKQAAPEADLQAIRSVREQFLKKHSHEVEYTAIRPGTEEEGGRFVPLGKRSYREYDPMTLAEAQAEKRTTQIMNRKKYGQLSPAQDEAEKNLAYSLRRQITALFPEVSALNAKDSAMIELEEQLRRFVGREDNKNIVGLIPAAATMGAGLGPAALLKVSLMALDNAPIKSKLAIAIYKASKTRLGRMTSATLKPSRTIPIAGRLLTPSE